MDYGGVFAQRQLSRCLSRGHPCKPPPYRSMHDQLKPASGVQNSGPWDPWQASDLKKKSLVYQQGGCRVQNSGPWDPWLPVVENSGLFTQRAHSARCAPYWLPAKGNGYEGSTQEPN